MSILDDLFLYICTKFKHLLPDQPCLLCGVACQNDIWCASCDAAMPYLTGAHCPICALPTWDGSVCGQCLKHPPHFKRTVAVFAYAFPLNKLMLAMKFSEKFQLANSLGSRLSRCVSTRPDCLVAMPLHPARLKERGFNQSLQLARSIGQLLDIPVLPFACQRVRDTPAQSSLQWKERSKNVRKAFICSADVAGKHVAMVDDVMTTGATLNELALALLHAGASEVSAWVVARTLPHAEQQ